jgi:hypothetical protein
MWAGILPSVALATVPTGSPTDKAVEVVGDFTPGIFLRGTAESISWNFNGAALPAGMTVFCGAVWTEQG